MMTPAERVLANSLPGENGCLLWQGVKNWGGYGRISVSGTSQSVHRVTYEAVNGAIPEGLEIDHLCYVRACVNVAHLEAVTHAENVRRCRPVDGPRKPYCPEGHQKKLEGGRWRCECSQRDRAVYWTRQEADGRCERCGALPGEPCRSSLGLPTTQHIVRHREPERPRNPTLTIEQVLSIRTRYADGGISTKLLGQEYGVSPASIQKIVRRQSWAHV